MKGFEDQGEVFVLDPVVDMKLVCGFKERGVTWSEFGITVLDGDDISQSVRAEGKRWEDCINKVR